MKKMFIALIFTFLVAHQQCGAESWNEKICPNGISQVETLLSLNPYDAKGKCFKYAGYNVQLLSKSVAFFSIFNNNTPFALIDFGRNSAPMGLFSGVVKGKEPYVYMTVAGAPRTISSFINVLQSKESIQYQEKLRADRLERESQIAAAKIENERIQAEEKALEEKKKNEKAKEKAEKDEIDAAEKAKKQLERRLEVESILEARWQKSAERLNQVGIEISYGIIIDKNSGLTWITSNDMENYHNPNGQISFYNRPEYKKYSDWRKPSASEVKSLSEYIDDISIVSGLQGADKCIVTTTNTLSKGSLFHKDCVNIYNGSIYSVDTYNLHNDNIWLVRGAAVSSFIKGLFDNL